MAPHPATVAAAAVYVAIAAAALLPRPASASGSLAGVGVNWGTMMSHPIYPPAVVEMLHANGVGRVKLFDADPWTVAALAGSGVQAMLAAPNDQLASLARDPRRAREWVRHNVTANLDAGVDVSISSGLNDIVCRSYMYSTGFVLYVAKKFKMQNLLDVNRFTLALLRMHHAWYVAVGNEPFLKSYNGSFINITFPALKNMQRALNEAGFGQRIKAVVPLNADVYSSPANKPVPSAGSFRRDINTLMVDIVNFLHMNDAPFVVNIYPYLSLYQNPNFPLNFSFFDGRTKPVYDKGMVYTNVFDANFDTLVWSLRKAGVPDMKIIVGEVGWPTDGDKNANVKYAQRFYNGFLKKMAKNIGTPLRPGHMEVYLFALIDENQKSVLPGRFERHWGLFTYDGKPKFFMDLGGNGRLIGVKGVQYLPAQWCVFNKDAKDKYKNLPDSVNYACSNADCTPLGMSGLVLLEDLQRSQHERITRRVLVPSTDSECFRKCGSIDFSSYLLGSSGGVWHGSGAKLQLLRAERSQPNTSAPEIFGAANSKEFKELQFIFSEHLKLSSEDQRNIELKIITRNTIGYIKNGSFFFFSLYRRSPPPSSSCRPQPVSLPLLPHAAPLPPRALLRLTLCCPPPPALSPCSIGADPVDLAVVLAPDRAILPCYSARGLKSRGSKQARGDMAGNAQPPRPSALDSRQPVSPSRLMPIRAAALIRAGPACTAPRPQLAPIPSPWMTNWLRSSIRASSIRAAVVGSPLCSASDQRERGEE
ncbi:hypothetical protein PR202_ga05775 [Eleusine coracana subsp. coracana]|uniref:Glucan endo-1,3-beta-D-glucosidase n=1 Tax=Eleusine coracana subsp. coracana TaxID=191504 RepID=A0AAV5BTQ5_ELECO|nr:hypothetical protein PR202_ga05775 [Eleusine coracana subsp. coracana]